MRDMPPYKRPASAVRSFRKPPSAKRQRRVNDRAVAVKRLQSGLRRIERQIETKEGTFKCINFPLTHNQLTVVNRSDGFVLNPFQSDNAADDPMTANAMSRIGDQVTVKRMTLTLMLETSLGRSNVHFRVFIIKMAKGDTLTRATFFRDCATNKLIDLVNTERFTVLARKTVRVTVPNVPPTGTIGLTGIPSATGINIGGTAVVRMSVSGKKFGRNGVVTFENKSTNQVKFFDYRVAIVAYDWYGTPQDVNTLGIINEGFVKLYFKDA